MPHPTGDLNQDGIVDSIDLSILVSNWNTADPTSDINNDGIVDSLDLSILVSNWGETAAGNGFNVLLVTENQTLSPADIALQNILTNDGHTVTTRAWSASEDYTNIDVVVVSIGNPPGDSGKYLHPPVGVVTVDSWRPLGMGTTIGFENNTNPVEVIDPASPLAAGVTGTFNAYNEPRYITWETDLSANPDIVVTRPSQPTQAVVFAYESGSMMTNRYATTRHVGLGYHRDGLEVGLTTQATNQLLAAITWAKDSPYQAPPPPAAPTNVIASASNQQVTISWDSVASADSYTIKRSTTDGGPYSTIQSSHTSTSFTDTNLSNGTTYYYVISATNTQGESPDSTQVSATPVEGSGGPVTGQLALLVTSEELAMWQDRAQNGPFRVAGDFSPNSPGHWTEMNACMSLNFSSARWDGPTTLNDDSDPDNHPPGAVRIAGGTGNDGTPSMRRMANDMMSAAYAAMVTNNTSVAQAIINEIEWQVQRPRLDHSNRTLYPLNYYVDTGPLFGHAHWGKDYLIAYSVTKAMGYSSAVIEEWFYNLAWLLENTVHRSLSGQMPNRKSDDYTSRGSALTTEDRDAHLLADGTPIGGPRIMYFYNNRRCLQAGFYGLAGVLLDDSFLIDEFKRFMREFVMFGSILGDYGGFGDMNRGRNTFPQLGFSYALHSMESCLPAMEALARKGDTDLYEFSSTDGATTPKWPTNYFKSMELVLDGHLKWIARTWPAQYTPLSTSNAGDPFFQVHSRNTENNHEIVNDANYLYAANYYNRSDWQNIILRQGTPSGFTPSPQQVGVLSGWRAGFRNRFLRSLDANPYT